MSEEDRLGLKRRIVNLRRQLREVEHAQRQEQEEFKFHLTSLERELQKKIDLQDESDVRFQDMVSKVAQLKQQQQKRGRLDEYSTPYPQRDLSPSPSSSSRCPAANSRQDKEQRLQKVLQEVRLYRCHKSDECIFTRANDI